MISQVLKLLILGELDRYRHTPLRRYQDDGYIRNISENFIKF